MRNIAFFFLGLFLSSSLDAQDLNILDFGAKPGAESLNTSFIQAAIDSANLQGGGRVVIPKGRFLSGTIHLKSGVELHMEEGSVLVGHVNTDYYDKIGYWKGLVLSEGQKNISITGTGTLDGNGREVSLRLDSLFYAGQIDSADYNFKQIRPKYYLRPIVVRFFDCKHVVIKDVKIIRAASWVQNYERCEDMVIDNIHVDSDAFWNNDGIDLVDCKRVRLTNSFFNASDDGICLKSHSRDHLCEDIFINNCTVRSSASAVKFGTKSLGGFRKITIKNIKVYDTFRSAIAIESVDGGILEDVLVDSVEAKNTGNAIFIKLGHRVKGEVATLKNITLQNIKVEVPFGRPDHAYEVRGPDLPFFHNTFPSSITGMPGHRVENVRLKNIEITFPGRGNKGLKYMPISRLDQVPEHADKYPEFSMFGELPAWGFYVRHVQGISFENIKLNLQAPDYRSALVFDQVEDLRIKNCEINGENKEKKVILRNASKTHIDNEAWILETQ